MFPLLRCVTDSVFSAYVLQQQLQPNTAAALQKAVPALTSDDIDDMMRAPLRSFDPNNLQVRSPSQTCACALIQLDHVMCMKCSCSLRSFDPNKLHVRPLFFGMSMYPWHIQLLRIDLDNCSIMVQLL